MHSTINTYSLCNIDNIKIQHSHMHIQVLSIYNIIDNLTRVSHGLCIVLLGDYYSKIIICT